MVARHALHEVYRRPAYLAAAIAIASLSAGILVWSGQVVAVFPQGGLFLNADPFTLMGLGVAALLLGITIPLHWFAWRRSAGAAAAQGVGGLGALFSVGSLSCCAPLLLPGILSLLGFSGTSLLALNLRLHQLRLPLTALAVSFLLLSLWMAVRNVARSCALPARRRASSGDSPLPAA